MPTVTIVTAKLTDRQLSRLLSGNVSKNVLVFKKGTETLTKTAKAAVAKAETVSTAKTVTPTKATTKLVENPEQYRRAPGTPQAGRGHPHTLSDAGLKLVFKLNKQGFDASEISAAFNGIVSTQSVSRLLSQIAKS
jgi:hypothetical protein